MNDGSAGWQISVVVHDNRDLLGSSILLDLIDKQIYDSWDFEPSGEIGILDVAPELLRGLVDGIVEAGYQLLVQGIESSAIPGPWPCTCSNAVEATYCMNRVLQGKCDTSIYPFSIWCFPAERRREIVGLIDEFLADRMNGEHFVRILEMGGRRFAVFRSSITYTFPSANLQDAYSLVVAATQNSKVEYVWDSWLHDA